MILNIVTPCSRIKNLIEVERSFKTVTNMNIKWHICFDSEFIPNILPIEVDHQLYCTKSVNYEISGNKQRNLILSNITDGFIYFLDDDNIIHPNLNNILNDVMYGKNYIFSQVYKNDIIRFKPHQKCIYPGRIDSAQMLVSASSLSNKTIWPLKVYLAEAFFAKYINDNNSFIFIDKIGSYYNYLR